MERVNEACNWIAERAFEEKTADKMRLQGCYYREIRERFGLSAQMTVRAINKVCDVYKRDKEKQPHFKLHGAIVYDQRILSFKAMDRVSILTLTGRILVSFVCGEYHRARLEGVRGQCDLIFKKGKWFLYVTVEVPEEAQVEPEEWLGVDLGIRNLAVDSDGEQHSGEQVEKVRQKQQRLRDVLQSVGTKSAKRHLKRLSGKEKRFRANVNHVISKSIVRKAKGTGRGIALEDLKDIRKRTTVRKSQRAMHSSWAFSQLRSFLTYKGALQGVSVEMEEAKDTSRTCPRCGSVDKRNRKSQSEFECKVCRFAGHADHVAAINIARRVTVNRPKVAAARRETRTRNPAQASYKPTNLFVGS